MNTRLVKNFVGVLVGAVMVSGAWAQTPPGVTISETRLNLTEEGTSGSYTVNLNTQPTGNVTVTITSNNAEVTTNPSALTFSNSDWATAQTVTVNAGSDADSMNDSAQLSHTVSGYGNVMAAAVVVAVTDDEAEGICGRTQQVRDAIVARVPSITDCANITPVHLGAITLLSVRTTTGPFDLQVGDFGGLTALTSLDLSNNQLSSLSAEVFSDLTMLLSLNLSNNQLSSLSAEAFDGLTALTTLELFGNRLRSLPPGIFDRLTSLRRLDIENNRLSSVPAGIFDRLTALRDLSLGRNQLSSLPAGLFANLTNLENLWLFSNQLSSLPALTDSTRLITLRLNNNQFRSLPRDIFFGLGGLRLLHLQGNPTISLPLTVSLVRISADQARARIHTGAPFRMNFPITVTNGTFAGGGTALTLTIARGDIESEVFTVIPSAGVTSVDLGTLPPLPTTSGIVSETPRNHLGYELVRSSGNLPLRFSQAGLDVIPTALTIAEEAADIYTVNLSTEPTGDVTVTVTSDDAAVTVDTDSAPGNQNRLTFTMGNWVTPQTVTVTAGDDSDAANETVTLSHMVSSGYGSMNMPSVTVTVADDDMPSVVVTPDRLVVAEDESETYTVVLNAPPTGDVSITINSDNSEVTVDADSTPQTHTLTFTVSDWDTVQTVTVSAAEDTDGMSDIAMLTHGVSGFGDVMAARTVIVTVDDNDAGVTVNPTSVTVTEEDSSGGTYTVVLDADPVGNVTIQINSDDPSVTPSPSALTFTDSTWDTPQTVTVMAGADDDGNDNIATLSHFVSGYGATIIPPDVMVMVDDNDTPGVTASPSADLTTNEDGTTATFTVVLNTEPTAVVTISLESSDTGEGTVPPDALTFATDAWNTAQTVTVTGVNDAIADGNQLYMITLDPSSGDSSYNGLDSVTVSVTNADDEAGVTANPNTGLATDEDGAMATFTVALISQPTDLVTVTVTSSNADEGIAAPGSLTFATDAWSTAQTVTVTGQNDYIDDGDQSYMITLDPSSDDTKYNALAPINVDVTNNDDDDTAGVTATPSTGLITGEDSTVATFTVVLDSEPTAVVIVSLSSSDDTEGTVPDALTFATSVWNMAQTVTVTGQNDAIADGTQSYTITLDPSSTDTNYDGLSSVTVSVTNTDDDMAGVTADPITGLITKEDPGAADRNATFTVVLNSEPTSPVTISLESSDTGEGTVPDALTFATAAWDMEQTVTVTGVDDAVDDGNQDYMVTLDPSSGDTNYAGLSSVTVSVTNNNDDMAGVTVDPSTGLTTGEDGTTATFTVVLNSEPMSPVTISLESSDTGEGTVPPDALTFATDAWNTAQTVTVTGQDDDIDDDNQDYMVTLDPSSGDTNYDSLSSVTISVTNNDDTDAAGVVVDTDSATTGPQNTGLTTGEDDTTATFTVVLNSEPMSPVTISLESSDTGEGTVPDALTFATGVWNTAQTVTVTGIDDAIADGNQPYTITLDPSSGDTKYDGLSSVTVSVTNADDDTPGVTPSPNAGLTTGEDGAMATFTVVLNTEPTEVVIVSVSSSNAGEGTAAPSALTFATDAWNTAQTVTVTGVDDAIADGNQSYAIELDPSSTDDGYDGLSLVTVSITNTDDDTAGVTVDPSTGLTTKEDLGAADRNATFTVVLDSEPTHPVTISLESSDTGEGTVPDALTFATDAWETAQTVTVTGVDDAVDDGDQSYTIELDPATSSDSNYDGLDPADVSVTNEDNDTAGVTISQTSLNLDEGPSGGNYTVNLNTQPTGNVMIDISSSNGEVTTNPSALTFTDSNWAMNQTVTVMAAEDGDALNDTAVLSHRVRGYGSVDQADDVTVVVTDLSEIPEITADINGDRYINAEDALLLFYIYRFEGSSEVRNTLLMRRLNDMDEVNEAIMRATAWKRSSRGDLNLDGDVDAQDALIMYFAWGFEDLNLAREHAALRGLLLNGLGTGTDSSYRQWLRSAQTLRGR